MMLGRKDSRFDVAVVVVAVVVVVVVVAGERDDADGNGGSGCKERRMRFVNAREGEKVWKTRTAGWSCG
jgi:hypothetical protein